MITTIKPGVIASGLSKTADEIDKQIQNQSKTKESESSVSLILIESLEKENIPLDEEDIDNLANAMKYMLHLRKLRLCHTRVHPRFSFCGRLFTAYFVEGLKNMHRLNTHVNRGTNNVQDEYGMPLEDLHIESILIVDSIEIFVNAYDYLPYLKYLRLRHTKLNARHTAAVFDKFVEVGQRNDRLLPLEILDIIG